MEGLALDRVLQGTPSNPPTLGARPEGRSHFRVDSPLYIVQIHQLEGVHSGPKGVHHDGP